MQGDQDKKAEISVLVVEYAHLEGLVAQLFDVRLYHFWWRITGGKHLWLRNNGSTWISQLVDTIIVNSIFLRFGLGMDWAPIVGIIGANYVVKILLAMIDTPLIYAARIALERWRAEEPEQARAVERAGGAELGLIAAEVQLVRAVLALKEERRGEPEEVAEALLRGPAAASLRPLLEHIGALELAMARQEREHVRRQLQRLPAEIERREQMRALLVTAELLRRTDRGDVLEW